MNLLTVWQHIVAFLVVFFANKNASAQADTVPPDNVSPPNVAQEPEPPIVEEEMQADAPVPTPPAPAPHVSLIEPFCLAIQSREGFFKPGQNPRYPNGTRAWRNNNPGNLKMGPFAKGCGAIGQDEAGFAVFPSYAKGFAALETLVHNAASGASTTYRPDMTILAFFQTYAPAKDKNDPISYAKEVAGKLGVDVDYQIKNLL